MALLAIAIGDICCTDRVSSLNGVVAVESVAPLYELSGSASAYPKYMLNMSSSGISYRFRALKGRSGY